VLLLLALKRIPLQASRERPALFAAGEPVTGVARHNKLHQVVLVSIRRGLNQVSGKLFGCKRNKDAKHPDKGLSLNRKCLGLVCVAVIG